ncbi:predicted protein [Coccidioides posadasii str. Silveira]|uniref:Predicted protein n=2 Tax=Coccidioides posadasii TaxID=199306 RepID=E9DHG7_COCPS|nr:predicted protein [Coccidioides posadasii str. Silveira]KMM65874.1 hypothetical protein CPAG_02215 [Coccidioides posadasii RMSCC 3488]
MPGRWIAPTSHSSGESRTLMQRGLLELAGHACAGSMAELPCLNIVRAFIQLTSNGVVRRRNQRHGLGNVELKLLQRKSDIKVPLHKADREKPVLFVGLSRTTPKHDLSFRFRPHKLVQLSALHGQRVIHERDFDIAEALSA